MNNSYKIPTPQSDKVVPSSTAIRRGVLRKPPKRQKPGMKRTHSRRAFTLGKSLQKKKKVAKKSSDSDEDAEEDEEEDEDEEAEDEDDKTAADKEVINDDG